MEFYEYLCEVCQKPNRKRYKSTRPKPRFCNNECTRKAAPWAAMVRKYEFTEERRLMLLQLAGKRHTAQQIMQDPLFQGIPRRKIWEWRCQLGLGSSRDARRWSDEEIALLEKYASYQPPWIAQLLTKKGFKRTDRGVASQLRLRRLNTHRMDYSASQIAEYFHCHPDTVITWVKRGYLKAASGGNRWAVRPGDLARFIRERPLLLNPYRPDVLFLISLLDNYKDRPKRPHGDT